MARSKKTDLESPKTKRTRSPKIVATENQKIKILYYIKPRFYKIFGKLKPGILDFNTKESARNKLFAFCHSDIVEYYIPDRSLLFKNLSRWKQNALDNFFHAGGTGGGPEKVLSESDQLMIETLCQNRTLGKDHARVKFIVLKSYLWLVSAVHTRP